MPNANPYGGSFAIPDQLHVDRISFDGDLVTIHASTEGPAAECPLCEQPSPRLHGSYTRTLADLPWCGTPVRLRVRIRKYFCDEPSCERRIFAERLENIAGVYARGTDRRRQVQRTLAEPIGLRAFQRALQSSLVEAFARPLDRGSGTLQHPGDLSVAERLCLGAFAYVDFEQDAGSVQLTGRGGARRDEQVRVLSHLLAQLEEVFLFIAALLQRRISPRYKHQIIVDGGLGNSLNKTPVDAPGPSEWHHALMVSLR